MPDNQQCEVTMKKLSKFIEFEKGNANTRATTKGRHPPDSFSTNTNTPRRFTLPIQSTTSETAHPPPLFELESFQKSSCLAAVGSSHQATVSAPAVSATAEAANFTPLVSSRSHPTSSTLSPLLSPSQHFSQPSHSSTTEEAELNSWGSNGPLPSCSPGATIVPPTITEASNPPALVGVNKVTVDVIDPALATMIGYATPRSPLPQIKRKPDGFEWPVYPDSYTGPPPPCLEIGMKNKTFKVLPRRTIVTTITAQPEPIEKESLKRKHDEDEDSARAGSNRSRTQGPPSAASSGVQGQGASARPIRPTPARALTEIPGQQDLKETAAATIPARARASTGTPGPQIQKKPTPAITATKRLTAKKSTGCKLSIAPFARKAAGKPPKSQVQTQRDDAYDLSSDSSEGMQAAMSQLGRFAS